VQCCKKPNLIISGVVGSQTRRGKKLHFPTDRLGLLQISCSR